MQIVFVQSVFVLIECWCCRGPFPTWVLPAAPGSLCWRHTHPMSHTTHTIHIKYTYNTHPMSHASPPYTCNVTLRLHLATLSPFGQCGSQYLSFIYLLSALDHDYQSKSKHHYPHIHTKLEEPQSQVLAHSTKVSSMSDPSWWPPTIPGETENKRICS